MNLSPTQKEREEAKNSMAFAKRVIALIEENPPKDVMEAASLASSLSIVMLHLTLRMGIRPEVVKDAFVSGLPLSILAAKVLEAERRMEGAEGTRH